MGIPYSRRDDARLKAQEPFVQNWIATTPRPPASALNGGTCFATAAAGAGSNWEPVVHVFWCTPPPMAAAVLFLVLETTCTIPSAPPEVFLGHVRLFSGCAFTGQEADCALSHGPVTWCLSWRGRCFFEGGGGVCCAVRGREGGSATACLTLAPHHITRPPPFPFAMMDYTLAVWGR